MNDTRTDGINHVTSWAHLLLAGFVVLWLSTGVAAPLINSIPSLLKVAALALWVIIAAGRSGVFLSRMVLNSWPLILFILITVLFADQVLQWRQYTQGLGYLTIAFALACFYSEKQYRREARYLLVVLVSDYLITGVRTFIALQSDPQLSRYLATTEQNRVAVYGNQSFAGLGGYSYAYSLAAILLVLLYLLVRTRRARLPLAVAIFAGLILLFELAFTTAIVLVLAMGLACLVWDVVSRRELKVFIYAVALACWITGLYSAAFNALASQEWVTEEVRDRLRELAGFLSGSVTSGSDLGTRLTRWGISIETFWDGGPFGMAGGGPTVRDNGAHSQWFDLLASYGLLTILLLLFLIFAWRLLKGEVIATGRVPLRRAWFYFIIVGFLNPVLFSTIVLTWMFCLPTLLNWFDEGSVGWRDTVSKRSPVETSKI